MEFSRNLTPRCSITILLMLGRRSGLSGYGIPEDARKRDPAGTNIRALLEMHTGTHWFLIQLF